MICVHYGPWPKIWSWPWGLPASFSIPNNFEQLLQSGPLAQKTATKKA